MSIWTAIGSLVGGFLSRKTAKEDRIRQDTQLTRLVADAKNAGISPLAALGSGMAGSYGTPVGGGNTGAYLGDAIAEGMEALKPSKASRLEEENQKLQNDLVRAQIDAIRSDMVQDARSRSLIPRAHKVAEVGTKANPLDLYVWANDPRTGKQGWLINPALSDSEQAVVAAGWHALNPMPADPGRMPKDPKFNPPEFFGDAYYVPPNVRPSKGKISWEN